jgi:hypothetical protein
MLLTQQREMETTRRISIPRRKVLFLAVVLGITLLGGFTRVRGAQLIANNYDEWIYLDASQNYAGYIEKLDIKNIVYLNENFEHPPLAKLVYALALVGIPRQPVTYAALMEDPSTPAQVKYMQLRARYVSAGLGTLAVLLLSLIHPLAGLFLAVQSLAVQFTSVVYLEALPSVTSLVAILAYDRWLKTVGDGGGRNRPMLARDMGWLGLSAVGVGLSVASKYMYAVVGIAIAIHFTGKFLLNRQGRKSHLVWLLAWITLAAVVFFVSDPWLWVKTGARLVKTISFHFEFSQSTRVIEYGYPLWQPLLWLFASVPDQPPGAIPYQPGGFLFLLDFPIALLALAGLPALWKRRTPYAVWLLVGMVMLMLWNTKWPQYVMIIAVPWCLSAAEGVTSVGRVVRDLACRRSIPNLRYQK